MWLIVINQFTCFFSYFTFSARYEITWMYGFRHIICCNHLVSVPGAFLMQLHLHLLSFHSQMKTKFLFSFSVESKFWIELQSQSTIVPKFSVKFINHNQVFQFHGLWNNFRRLNSLAFYVEVKPILKNVQNPEVNIALIFLNVLPSQFFLQMSRKRSCVIHARFQSKST